MYGEFLQKKEQERQNNEFDRHKKYDAFKKEYADRIRNGYTKDRFLMEYATTEDDVKIFERVAADIQKEDTMGDAFLAGFNE